MKSAMASSGGTAEGRFPNRGMGRHGWTGGYASCEDGVPNDPVSSWSHAAIRFWRRSDQIWVTDTQLRRRYGRQTA